MPQLFTSEILGWPAARSGHGWILRMRDLQLQLQPSIEFEPPKTRF